MALTEPNVAAIFDLDRTLLAGASGPIISSALKSTGLMSDRNIPGEDLLFKVFNVVGENRPSMMLTKQAVRFAKGWARETAQAAGKIAAEELAANVQPYARVLIEQHHEAGRLVVIASTTPYDMVKPLADLLGIDHVVATRYGVKDGFYDGTINGPFVWGRGKVDAVKYWCKQHNVSLRDSYAYSDSFYDAALLGEVDHPVVVNPDPRMRVLAVARRWPTMYFDVPPGVPKLVGVEPQQVIMPLARPELVLYAKLDIQDVENIPLEGPAIICGNHRSYFDPLALGYAFAKRGRPVRFLGKKEVFDAPVVGDIASAMGGIRVERGSGSDEPLKEAAAALAAGELVAIMPQGTIPRGKAFFDPELKGRWGAAKLAAMTGAPIVPVGLWGTEKVWPRNAKVPNFLNIMDPPDVRIRVGKPIELEHEDMDVDTKRMMQAIQDLLPPEAREWHEPTSDELALTLPSSYKGDPGAYDREEPRRPGSD